MSSQLEAFAPSSARSRLAGRPVAFADQFQSHFPATGSTLLALGVNGLHAALNKHCVGSL